MKITLREFLTFLRSAFTDQIHLNLSNDYEFASFLRNNAFIINGHYMYFHDGWDGPRYIKCTLGGEAWSNLLTSERRTLLSTIKSCVILEENSNRRSYYGKTYTIEFSETGDYWND